MNLKKKKVHKYIDSTLNLVYYEIIYMHDTIRRRIFNYDSKTRSSLFPGVVSGYKKWNSFI